VWQKNTGVIGLKEKTERLWSRDFLIIMAACSGISFCNYFMTSTLPVYAENLTGSNVYSGLLLTVFTISALATRPLTGFLAERFGRVKLLICGAIVCAIAGVLYHFASVIILLLIIRGLQGIGFGIHTTSGGTVAVDVIPKSRLSEGLGIFGLYGTIAQAIAPGIALAIIGEGNMDDFRPLFILVAAVALLSMVLDSLIRYEKKKTAIPAAADAEKPIMIPPDQLPKTFLGFEYGVFLPSAVLILVFMAFSGVTSFLVLYAKHRGLGYMGPFFIINAAGLLLSRVFLGKVTDRQGPDPVVIPFIAILTCCLALIPFGKSAAFLFILAFPLGLAQGAVCPALNTMMFQRSSEKRKGMAAAAYFSSIDIGFGIGSLFFGFIAEWMGYRFVYWGAALFSTAALVIYLMTLAGKKKKAVLEQLNK
jgi:MFS family permease